MTFDVASRFKKVKKWTPRASWLASQQVQVASFKGTASKATTTTHKGQGVKNKREIDTPNTLFCRAKLDIKYNSCIGIGSTVTYAKFRHHQYSSLARITSKSQSIITVSVLIFCHKLKTSFSTLLEMCFKEHLDKAINTITQLVQCRHHEEDGRDARHLASNEGGVAINY